MLYLRSFNRFILISLALVSLSVSSPSFASLLYDESISGDTDPWFVVTRQDIGSVVSGDHVLGTVVAPDWDGWLFTLDGSIDEIVFELLGGTKNNAWQLYPTPFNGSTTGTDMATLALTHSWDTSSLIGAYILGNNTLNSSSNYSYKISFISAVPIPAAIWLFGTAMIGLVGFGRRRKAA